jgi:peptide methionine sulfoxide reductase MsrA
VIFYRDKDQQEVAEKVMASLEEQKIYDKPIVTQLRQLDQFRVAE